MTSPSFPLTAPADPVPALAGTGLRFSHAAELLECKTGPAWIEIHAENFMSDGGLSLSLLDRLTERYPVSVHGVGLSLGSAGTLDRDHLARLRKLTNRVNPGLISEHLAWCQTGNHHFADLLPLPYTEEALDVVCAHVDEAQNSLNRRLLIENPSLYVSFHNSECTEPEFLEELARRTGCGILLDVNNVHVSSHNLGYSPERYINSINPGLIGEVHLAGHATRDLGNGRKLLIDDHGSAVSDEVWQLYDLVLSRTGALPTLVEWDNNEPTFDELISEARKADYRLSALQAGSHVRAS